MTVVEVYFESSCNGCTKRTQRRMFEIRSDYPARNTVWRFCEECLYDISIESIKLLSEKE